MSEYNELQKEASSLGLKAVGVSKDELKKSIAEVKDNPETNAPSDPETEPETQPETPVKKVGKPNTAIVMHGGQEVRRYTTLLHGKNFEKLAQEFAGSRGDVVELKTVDFDNKCPNCGYQL